MDKRMVVVMTQGTKEIFIFTAARWTIYTNFALQVLEGLIGHWST